MLILVKFHIKVDFLTEFVSTSQNFSKKSLKFQKLFRKQSYRILRNIYPSSSSGKHPNFNGFNGLGTVEFLQKEKSPTYAIQSQPLIIENSSQFSPYKHQYKGDPYKKRILEEDNNGQGGPTKIILWQEQNQNKPSGHTPIETGQGHTYFPVQPRSDDADHDQSKILQVEEEEILEDQVDADKNSRKML